MARCPFAAWRGTVPNESGPGTQIAHRGLVLHVEEGGESGTDSWFHNPSAQASAHFGVGDDGALDQWVDTDDKAWAEMAGNPYWVSVETSGKSGQPFTSAQILTLARLYAWLAGIYGWPMAATDDPAGTGLGWHGMGGAAWGGHYDCPGPPRVSARGQILYLAAGAPGQEPDMTSQEHDLLVQIGQRLTDVQNQLDIADLGPDEAGRPVDLRWAVASILSRLQKVEHALKIPGA